MPFQNGVYSLPFRIGTNTPTEPQYSGQVGADFDEIAGIINNGPFINVKTFGVVGDGITDDTATVQAAIDAADSSGMSVLFPPGSYLLSGGVTVNQRGTLLIGVAGNGGAPFLHTGGADVTLVQLNASTTGIMHLFLTGGDIGSGNPTIELSPQAIESFIYDCGITGGANAILCRASDVYIELIHAESVYGNAIVKFYQGNGVVIRGKCDQNFPVNSLTPPYDPVAWASATLYAVGDVVFTPDNYLIQCAVGGTSGGAAPTVANYGVNMPDGAGTLIWQLVAPQTYYSYQFDTESGGTLIECDATGPFSTGIVTTDSDNLGGAQNIRLMAVTVGQFFNDGIGLYGNVAGVMVTNAQITNGISSVSNGVNIDGAHGDITISSAVIFGMQNAGIHLAGVTGSHCNMIAVSNQCFSCVNAGIMVEPDASYFIINANNCGTSDTWGSNGIGIQVKTGTSDFYNITDNMALASGISDAGTGVNKAVNSNI